MTQPTLKTVKAQAKALQQALETSGTSVSHAQSLELIAQQYGARDWNTLSARLGHSNITAGLTLGTKVKGHYLGQPYSGEIISISGPSGHRLVEIALDQPINTVRFDSFSNWRWRIRGTLDKDGRSTRKTSNSTPHLIVEPSNI